MSLGCLLISHIVFVIYLCWIHVDFIDFYYCLIFQCVISPQFIFLVPSVLFCFVFTTIKNTAVNTALCTRVSFCLLCVTHAQPSCLSSSMLRLFPIVLLGIGVFCPYASTWMAYSHLKTLRQGLLPLLFPPPATHTQVASTLRPIIH